MFGEALCERQGNEPRQVTVKRRASAPTRRTTVPLATYVQFRVSQGIDVQDAVQEWNGDQMLTV